MKPMTAEWASKAEGDFAMAERECLVTQSPNYDGVCFHAQQCAEKYLKAALIQQNVEFPRTHDLVVLFNLLQKADPLPLRIEDVQPLNRYSIEARYPGDWEPIEEDETRNAFEMAKKIRGVVREQLGLVLSEKE